MKLSERIREARTSASLSQRQLAESVGVSERTVTYWETADRQPDTIHLVRIARATRQELSYFTEGLAV